MAKNIKMNKTLKNILFIVLMLVVVYLIVNISEKLLSVKEDFKKAQCESI